jgi:N-carbamoyl-L-amino-acid hydrolase
MAPMNTPTLATRTAGRRAAAALDQARLWSRLMKLATAGATPAGGVNRQAFSPADVQARRMLSDWGRELGLKPYGDEIGNLYLRCEGRDKDADPVLAGSHLDSQPKGGKFDGAYGVVAALTAVEAIRCAGLTTRRPVEVVAWSNEEGSRFQPGTMGSGVFTGVLQLNELLPITDSAGIRLESALQNTLRESPPGEFRAAGFPVAAYVEAHIEQGPVLERAGLPVGVVSGTQGLRWFRVEVAGEAAHAGTTPMRLRRDALKAAAALVTKLDSLLTDEHDTARYTVGRFEVEPNAPSTVPDRVLFTIDLRHPDSTVLEQLTARIERLCSAPYRSCGVTLTRTEDVLPTPFDEQVIDVIRRACESLSLAHQVLLSGAGHDAMLLASVCPTGMIFVPCKDGVSHNETEAAAPEDLVAGARVLTQTLLELAEW